MKLLAALPTIILVSLCGSSVPPPGAHVSGTLYYDANHNGIRDSCDSPRPEENVAVITEDGDVITDRVDLFGKFTFSDVPVGDVLVTMAPEPGRTWPITTLTEDGRRGVALSLRPNDAVDGVEFGVASRNSFDDAETVVIGVAFDDKDGDGVVDRDECGIAGARARLPGGKAFVRSGNGAFEVVDDAAADGILVTTFRGLWVNFGQDPDRDILPADEVYAVEVTPERVFGANLYEANVGFHPAGGGRGGIKGVVWNDADRDGERDPGEEGLPGLSVNVGLAGPCSVFEEQGQNFETVTGEDGSYEIEDLPRGYYQVHALTHVLASETTLVDGDPDQDAVVPVRAGDLITGGHPGAAVGGWAFERAGVRRSGRGRRERFG